MATSNELSVNALLLALETVFDPAAAVDATVALRVDGDWFRVTVAEGSIDIAHGRSDQPTVTLDSDAVTLRAVAFGREAIGAAERAGRPTVTGDRRAAKRFARMIPVADPADEITRTRRPS